MADQQQHQHQHQHTTFQYILDSTGIGMHIESGPHDHQDRDRSQSQGQMQNQTHMSPANRASAPSTLIYHPYAHAQPPSYASVLHEDSENSHLMTLDPAHLRASSIGPSRVLTRRQAARMAAHAYPGTPQDVQQQQRRQQFEQNFGLYGASANSPPPQTPNGFHTGPQLTDAHIGLGDLALGQLTIPNNSSTSPQHPSTPTSVTSSANFSHYGFPQYAPNGHSRSGSSSTHPRSTSPASVVSAATTVSSGSNPKPARSRPPVSTTSVGCISVSSFCSTPLEPMAVKPKRRLQNRQRKEICQYYLEHPNARQEDIAMRWGVERSTVSKILKHKNRWMAVSDGDEQVVAKHRPPKFADIENAMGTWLIECRDSNTPISDAMIRAKARECARQLDIADDKFKASAGWVENYKHRANIKKGIWIGRPMPGVYSDDETDDDSPLLSDVVEAQRRADALKEADERALRVARESENGAEIPTLDLGPSPMSLNEAVSWPPTLGLALDDNGSTNTSRLEHMSGLPNGMGELKDGQETLGFQPSVSFGSNGNLLQHHLAAASAAWTVNGGVSNPDTTGGPPPVPVSVQDASSALDTLLRFLQTQRPEFLNEQERNILTDIKHVIWLATAEASSASGITANSAPVTGVDASSIATIIGKANTTSDSVASGGVSTGVEAICATAS